LGIGPVIALGRSIDSTTGAVRPLTGLIEARDGIRPGQSGGPMLTRDGVVVGVNVAYLYRPATGAPSGVGYAIPINRALRIAHVLLAHHTASGLGARGTHRAHHPGHARRARFGRVGSVIGAG
jgi:S1-C subfamily serine protease